MAQESTGWGGRREGQGRPTKIPVGTGEKTKITLSIGSDLLKRLRATYPGLSDQDTLRAALWSAIGEDAADS